MGVFARAFQCLWFLEKRMASVFEVSKWTAFCAAHVCMRPSCTPLELANQSRDAVGFDKPRYIVDEGQAVNAVIFPLNCVVDVGHVDSEKDWRYWRSLGKSGSHLHLEQGTLKKTMNEQ
jgi:hypothetical protein